jgi:hypothetical protein
MLRVVDLPDQARHLARTCRATAARTTSAYSRAALYARCTDPFMPGRAAASGEPANAALQQLLRGGDTPVNKAKASARNQTDDDLRELLNA